MTVFLIGFMAAGKTSVGRALAAQTGRRFVDLDDAIAEAGEPPAALVARDETEFRKREAAALQSLIASGDDLVLATGGGAATFGDNLARMRDAGLVIALGVDPDEAVRRARVAGEPVRPLLASAQTLAVRRAPMYRRAHAVVDTMGRGIDEVVRDVRAVERAWRAGPALRDAIFLALDERSYGIVVEPELPVAALRAQLSDASRIAIITDANVARFHLANLLGVLEGGAYSVEPIVLDPGEASKAFAVYQQLAEDLVRRGLDRGSLIVALGGGVVGDLAGFVAATLFRGIPILQIPTTIVAMTDAAIGGKTAIDLPAGKNLVGAFHQPRLVACSLATLVTLPGRERRAGFGELWKYAVLDGGELWSAVAACTPWAAGPEHAAPPEAFTEVVRCAIAYKAAIVSRDERERTGHRALLNLGHTVGHAIESASGMLHGEAVALGLLAACRVSVALGYPDREPELCDALARTGLPTDLDRWLTDDVLARIAVDKKRIGGTVSFIAIRDLGVCAPHGIAVADLQRILRRVPTPR